MSISSNGPGILARQQQLHINRTTADDVVTLIEFDEMSFRGAKILTS